MAAGRTWTCCWTFSSRTHTRQGPPPTTTLTFRHYIHWNGFVPPHALSPCTPALTTTHLPMPCACDPVILWLCLHAWTDITYPYQTTAGRTGPHTTFWRGQFAWLGACGAYHAWTLSDVPLPSSAFPRYRACSRSSTHTTTLPACAYMTPYAAGRASGRACAVRAYLRCRWPSPPRYIHLTARHVGILPVVYT